MIDQLLAGRNLTESEASALLTRLTNPDAPAVEKAGLLVALRAKGETATELRGLAMAMREAAVSVDLGDVADTAGTGGDGKGTVNLSTAAALVVAAAGHRVAKHGNRSVSSRCGSADVLEALGIRVPASPDEARAQVDEHGFTFLFAPTFHPAMKGVASVRRGMRTRTAFNLLGPLVNPARPRRQLIGAFSEDAARRLANAAVGLVPRATVVHGLAGHDEPTPVSPFVAFEVVDDVVVRRIVDPAETYGIPRCDEADLRGGDAASNAARIAETFEGRPGPLRDAVCLSAALVLELCGEPEPMTAATRAIDNGAVMRLLEGLRG